MSSERTVHRALLESSVLLVTLLFVIAGVVPKSNSFLIGIAFDSMPFVFTMICSLFLMLALGLQGIVYVSLVTAGGATVFMWLLSRAERKGAEARYA